MYYLLLGFFYLFSLLPFFILYRISDLLYLLTYYVIRYRRETVMNNLELAFPEKTEAERIRIAKKFYRNFIDTFIEAIKLLTLSNKQLEKRIQCDFSIFDELFKKGKSVQVHLGHNFNWEYANLLIAKGTPFQFLVVYMPIKTRAIDRLFLHFRKKTGTKLISRKNMRVEMLPFRNKQYLIGLAADQKPDNPSYAYWLNFFNAPAPFLKGPEKFSRNNQLPVVFANISKFKRGYYRLNLELAEENAGNTKEGELTKRFVRYIEENTRKQPDIYLWSHKRWKHPFRKEYMPLWIDDRPPAANE